MTGVAGTDHPRLLAILDAIAGVRVGCVGDVMLDRYVYGSVERVSPEAPVPVLKVEREARMPGGAGNVVRNLAALGAEVSFAGVVGDDAAGRDLDIELGKAGAGLTRTLVIDRERPTTVKTRFVAGTQQLLRTDGETATPLSDEIRQQLLGNVERWVGQCPVIVLSDYAKGVLLGDVAAEVMGLARVSGARVIVDPKGDDYSRYCGADLITPNRRELARAVDAPVAPGEEVAAARALLGRFALGAVLVTLGRDGMVLIEAGGKEHHLPAEARDVFDVSGAGDTVVAALGCALAAGASLRDAAVLANVAAGIVVGKVGTAVAQAREVRQALRRQDLLLVEEKVFALDELRARVEAWRRQGLRVGFTNGCFDLIHPGHVSLLHQARAACDRLIVGLNSDASVTRLKGPARPVQPEAARATVVASLAAVDAVVLFEDDTPLALIEALRPDLLVKGQDYQRDQVVGADLVESYGGRVLLARLEPGFSTSATLAGSGRFGGPAGRMGVGGDGG